MFQLIMIIFTLVIMAACGLCGFFFLFGAYEMNHERFKIDCIETPGGQVAFVGGEHLGNETVTATFYTADGRLDPTRQARVALGGVKTTACPLRAE